MATKANNKTTGRSGRAVDKKPISDKQRKALQDGRKPLKKNDARTKEIASMGGKATAEKLQGEALVRKILALKPKNDAEVVGVLAQFDLSPDDVSEETLIHIAAINKAKDGDMAAYEKVLKAAGFLKDKVEASVTSIPDPVTNFID